MSTEEQPVAVEAVTEVTVSDAAVEDKQAGKAAKSKKGKDAKEKSSKPKRKSPSSAPKHPPYYDMIKEAVSTLKERKGSSSVAIAKVIEDKNKQLPGNFRKILYVQLKKFAASGKLLRIKSSFKLPQKAPKAAGAVSRKKKSVSKVKTGVKGRKPKTAVKKVAAKPKAKMAVKPKPAGKAKSPAKPKKTVKSEVATPKPAPAVKSKAAVKRKATAKAVKKERPVKVAKTSARPSPAKAPAALKVKKTPVKAPAKAKVAKSPAKKAAVGKKGKK